MARKKKDKAQTLHSPRTHAIHFLLNDEEKEAIDRYLAKYKIENKSRWYRETILSHVLKNRCIDYPTLFSEQEMRR